MPPAPRRQRALPPTLRNWTMDNPSDTDLSESAISPVPSALLADIQAATLSAEDDDEEEEEEEEEEEHEEEAMEGPLSPVPPPLPGNLREISSLASWTVSSSKPGCSVPQLRSNDTNQFWQSDGPQPHLLNIHFFKQVSIVGVRLYLDFENDESYTPTHIQFLAGTGYNDLQMWADMRFEQPKGWIDVDFSGVGRDEPLSDSDGSDNDGDDTYSPSMASSPDSNMSAFSPSRKRRGRRGRARKHVPVLRAYLVQIKILENHQNGKDTHLRGVQIFARDKSSRDKDAADPVPTDEGGAAHIVAAAATKPKSAKSFMVPEWATVPAIR